MGLGCDGAEDAVSFCTTTPLFAVNVPPTFTIPALVVVSGTGCGWLPEGGTVSVSTIIPLFAGNRDVSAGCWFAADCVAGWVAGAEEADLAGAGAGAGPGCTAAALAGALVGLAAGAGTRRLSAGALFGLNAAAIAESGFEDRAAIFAGACTG